MRARAAAVYGSNSPVARQVDSWASSVSSRGASRDWISFRKGILHPLCERDLRLSLSAISLRFQKTTANTRLAMIAAEPQHHCSSDRPMCMQQVLRPDGISERK